MDIQRATWRAGGYFAELLAQICEGSSLREAIELARRPLVAHDRSQEVSKAIDAALQLASGGAEPSPELVGTLGGAWIGEEALSIALSCSLVARDFDHGVRLAVNHSGDPDSTGALVGNVLGALWGAEAIPARWLADLQLRKAIETTAADLTAVRSEKFDTRAEFDRYPGW